MPNAVPVGAMAKRSTAMPTSNPAPAGTDADPAADWPARLTAYRCRQSSVASILDSVLGPFAQCNPELWERRTYLMLVGLVYGALCEDELPTAELTTLAKVLSELRPARLRGPTRDPATSSAGEPPAGQGKLPDRFADIVRQVYGTNFHPPAETTPAGDQNA